jgi:hypothetical protein
VPAVQSPHDADAREHGGAAEVCQQDERFDRGPPFRRGGFAFGQGGDLARGVAPGDQYATARQADRFVELAAPT